MKLTAIQELIELAKTHWPQVARKAASEAKRVEVAQETLREMFDDRVLDPYPTSDASSEMVLRKFCGWTLKEHN
jgi:hypothetical protein